MRSSSLHKLQLQIPYLFSGPHERSDVSRVAPGLGRQLSSRAGRAKLKGRPGSN